MDLPRVCLVSFEFPPRVGGEGSYAYNLFKALRRLNCEVTVITPLPHDSIEDDERILDVGWTDLPGLKIVSFGIRARRKIMEVCKSREIDVIHYTSDYSGFGMSRSEAQKPIVATIHHVHQVELEAVSKIAVLSGPSLLRYRLRMWLLDKLERDTVRKADRVIAVSEFTARCVAKRHNIMDDRIRVVGNCLDPDIFTPRADVTSLRDKLGLKDHQIVLYVGRFSQNKGLNFLLSAFCSAARRVPKAILAIVGDTNDEQKAALNRAAAKYGLEEGLVFLGRVSNRDLPRIYCLADAVVSPSLMEGFGMSLLEGMASGKPCIASRVGGIPELVDDGRTGILVPPGDVEELANAITTVLTDGDFARLLGEAARKEVEQRFSLERMGQQVLDIYREVLTETIA